VRSLWLGSAGQWEGLERQVEVADDRAVDDLDVRAAHQTRIRPVGWTAPDEVREASIVPIVRVRPASALSRATVSLATLFHAIDSRGAC
jgi:hypothetical protein